MEPAPTRKRTGSSETFLKAHWDVMAAFDLTTVEVWTKEGLTTCYLLFLTELRTRRVNFAGWITNPNEAWMKTIARELTSYEDGFLKDKKYLMMDRDSTFSKSFRLSLRNEGVKSVRLPPRIPDLKAHLERFFGSLKSECLYKLILFGENANRKDMRSFLDQYHTARNHQGLDNELIVPMDRPPDVDAEIETTQRLASIVSTRGLARPAFTRFAPLRSQNIGVKPAARRAGFESSLPCHRSN